MIGWMISVCRLADGGHSPGTEQSREGQSLAIWQTDHEGLDWLNELARAGKAIDLGGNGYPNRYTATAEHVIPRILDGPPGARPWQRDERDVVGEDWPGETSINAVAARQCRFDEWLLVIAFDES